MMKRVLLAAGSVAFLLLICCGFSSQGTRPISIPRTAARRQVVMTDDRAHAFDDWQTAIDNWFADCDQLPDRVENFVNDLSRAIDGN